VVIALPLGDAAVAVVGLLLIAAAVPLADLTVLLLSQIPVIGGPAARVAKTAFLSAVSVLARWSQQSADAFASVVQGPVVAVWTMIDAMIGQDWLIVQTVYALATVTLPRLVGWTWALVMQEVGQVIALVQADVQWLANWTAGQLAQLRADLVAVVSWTAATIESTAAGLESRALAREQALASYAQSLAVQAIERADADAIAAEHFAAAAATTVERYAESLWREESLRARAAEQDLADYAGRLGRALQADIAAGEAAAAAAAAAAVATVATAVQAIEDSPCIRNCGPLGEIGQLATDLEGAGLLAILLGLLVQASTDPQGLAEGMQAVLVEPAREVLSGLGVKVAA